MKGRPCASASRRLLFQSIQAWRSCLRPSWRPSWRPFWRPSSSPSRRSRSRCGLSHFSSRYLLVTMMKPPPASNTVTIISEYMIISDSADALVWIMAIIVSTALFMQSACNLAPCYQCHPANRKSKYKSYAPVPPSLGDCQDGYSDILLFVRLFVARLVFTVVRDYTTLL